MFHPSSSRSKSISAFIIFSVLLITGSNILAWYYGGIYGSTDAEAFRHGQQDQYQENYNNGFYNGSANGNITGEAEGQEDGYFNGYNDGFNEGSSSFDRVSRNISPKIDGNLNENEWQYATQIINHYTADELFGGNGWQYIYIGQNKTHLLIGMDLCSSRFVDMETQWFGFFLHTNLSVPFGGDGQKTYEEVHNKSLDVVFWNTTTNSLCAKTDFIPEVQDIMGNSTIKNIQFAKTFGKTVHDNVDHWSFEIAIPSSQMRNSYGVNRSMSIIMFWDNHLDISVPYNPLNGYILAGKQGNPMQSDQYYPLPLNIPRNFLSEE